MIIFYMILFVQSITNHIHCKIYDIEMNIDFVTSILIGQKMLKIIYEWTLSRVPWNMLYSDVRVHNFHKSHGLNERCLIQNMMLVNSKLPETFEIFTQMSDSVFLPISQWGTIGNTHKSCSSKCEKIIRRAKSMNAFIAV